MPEGTFTIDMYKMERIVAVVHATRPEVDFEHIRNYVLADWPEGEEHQKWLDTAEDAEIAGWVIEGLQ